MDKEKIFCPCCGFEMICTDSGYEKDPAMQHMCIYACTACTVQGHPGDLAKRQEYTWTHVPPTEEAKYLRRERKDEESPWGAIIASWVMCPEDIKESSLVQWSNRPFVYSIKE